jgi:hypothetical protein
MTDLVVEEFVLDGVIATAPSSPLPQLSIALVDGVPGRSVIS